MPKKLLSPDTDILTPYFDIRNWAGQQHYHLVIKVDHNGPDISARLIDVDGREIHLGQKVQTNADPSHDALELWRTFFMEQLHPKIRTLDGYGVLGMFPHIQVVNGEEGVYHDWWWQGLPGYEVGNVAHGKPSVDGHVYPLTQEFWKEVANKQERIARKAEESRQAYQNYIAAMRGSISDSVVREAVDGILRHMIYTESRTPLISNRDIGMAVDLIYVREHIAQRQNKIGSDVMRDILDVELAKQGIGAYRTTNMETSNLPSWNSKG